MAAHDLYILPAEVQLTPVQELAVATKEKFEYDEEDFVITYTHARNTSKIIDAASASLVKEFRSPRSLPEGVFTYAAMHKLDPEKTLEEAYTFLVRLRSEGFLVLYDDAAPQKNPDALKPGEIFNGFEVIEKLPGVNDTEIYKLKKDHAFYALKLLKTNGKISGLAESFYNEIKVLKYLDGAINPTITEHGEYNGNCFLIMQWANGLPCGQAAEKYRNTGDIKNLLQLLSLCCGILKAYIQLHAQGIIHSDVHPGNLLIDEEGQVRIIDFGLARIASEEKHIARGGVGFFYEPEYAAAIVNNKPQPASTYKGEQYALAALLYVIITGKQYLNFSFEKEILFKQILNDAPILFAANDLDIPPSVEQVIFKALSKNPGDRFHSLNEFYEQLSAVKDKLTQSNSTALQYSFNAFCDTLKTRYGFNSNFIEKGLQLTPAASVNYGAAGIAYMFYRMALAESDAALLSVADVWANRAAELINDSEKAFYSKEIDITPANVGNTSIYHTASGVYLVQALISKELGDYNTHYRSVINFIHAASQPCENLDLTLGQSAALIGCTVLYPNLFAHNDNLKNELTLFANNIIKNIWTVIDGYAPIAEQSPINYRGIAHGWAGILYATVKWCAAANQPLPENFLKRTEQLLSLGVEEDNFIRWHLTADNPVSWPGWCHGSAGYTFLWTALYRFTNDEKFLLTAEKTAKHFLITDEQAIMGSLCCGAAGECYALLNLYNTTQNNFYLAGAKRLAKKMLPHIYAGQMRNHSLYKGDVGIGVLFTELACPQFAKMPLFE